jgi:hypothetical protein
LTDIKAAAGAELISWAQQRASAEAVGRSSVRPRPRKPRADPFGAVQLPGTDISHHVWSAKYRHRDADCEERTIAETWRRVATALAAEERENKGVGWHRRPIAASSKERPTERPQPQPPELLGTGGLAAPTFAVPHNDGSHVARTL